MNGSKECDRCGRTSIDVQTRDWCKVCGPVDTCDNCNQVHIEEVGDD